MGVSDGSRLQTDPRQPQAAVSGERRFFYTKHRKRSSRLATRREVREVVKPARPSISAASCWRTIRPWERWRWWGRPQFL